MVTNIMREDTKNLTRGQKLKVYSHELLKKRTEAERAFEKILQELDIIYVPQKTLLNANAIVDYYIPLLNMCYEIDGGYHDHRKEKDKKRSARIRRLNMGVSRIMNDDVLSNPEQVKERIAKHIENKKKLIEKNVKKFSDKTWYKNLANIEPRLRFKHKLKDNNLYQIRRWEYKAKQIRRSLSLNTVV